MKLTDQDCYEIAEFCLNSSNCIGCKLYKNTSCRILRYQEEMFRTIVNQKSEIERLTEENNDLASGLSCERVVNRQQKSLLDNFHECDKLLRKENAELQKQVDELKEKLWKSKQDMMTYHSKTVAEAVKDTAKEIYSAVLEFCPVHNDGSYSKFVDLLEEWLKHKYGVEVE